MKLYYPDQASAQAKCDDIHTKQIATSPAYAKSVADGQTKRWDVPAQDRDALGNIIPASQWGVVVKDRVSAVLTPGEKTLLGIAAAPLS